MISKHINTHIFTTDRAAKYISPWVETLENIFYYSNLGKNSLMLTNHVYFKNLDHSSKKHSWWGLLKIIHHHVLKPTFKLLGKYIISSLFMDGWKCDRTSGLETEIKSSRYLSWCKRFLTRFYRPSLQTSSGYRRSWETSQEQEANVHGADPLTVSHPQNRWLLISLQTLVIW